MKLFAIRSKQTSNRSRPDHGIESRRLDFGTPHVDPSDLERLLRGNFQTFEYD